MLKCVRTTAVACSAIFFVLLTAPASRATEIPTNEVDLTLVLLVDVSRSIIDVNWDLQRKGYASAFRNAEIVKLIQDGPIGAIAVTYVEWASCGEQYIVIPWTRISGLLSAEAFARTIENSRRSPTNGTGTCIYEALGMGMQQLRQSPFISYRKAIDISGDGMDSINLGRVEKVRGRAITQGITINGLPIPTPSSEGQAIDEYYSRYVIGGPGHFMVVATGWENFPEAIRYKLALEVAGKMPPTPVHYASK